MITWNINGSAHNGYTTPNGAPVALHRGGNLVCGSDTGVFALYANFAPSNWYITIGFRSAR